MKHILGLLGLSLLLCASTYGAPREVRVTAAKATVYDAPKAGAVVLGQLSRGTRLQSTGRTQGDWLAVEAPPEISGWIFGELLRGNIVEASSVRVRSGPGVGYEGLGSLSKGDQIIRRGSQGDWVELAGTSKMRVWVERSMVSAPAAVDLTASAPKPPKPPEPSQASSVSSQPSPPPQRTVETRPTTPDPVVKPPAPVHRTPSRVVTKPVPKPSVTPSPAVSMPIRRQRTAPRATPRPVVPATRATSRTPPPVSRTAVKVSPEGAQAVLPSGYRLVATAPQGQRVRMKGLIRPVGFGFFRPAKYRLISDPSAFPRRTSAYLVSDQINLLLHANRNATITGTRFWLLGVREPVIVVDTLQD